MRPLSQNGWPVLNAEGTVVISAGRRNWRVARGQVATTFQLFIARYATEVEPIDKGELDDWAWAVRTVRGSKTEISNHASGTAVDINALAHPRGAKNTFPRAKLLALHDLLDDYPVLRWGGSFGTTVDDMHFEISCTPAELDTWLRTGARPATTGGGLRPETIRPVDPEDDDVTPADIAAIAAAVSQQIWHAQKVDVLHPGSGQAQSITMHTALGRAASVIADGRNSGVLTDPEDLTRHLWEGYGVAVQHPISGKPETINMATAVGRGASVIRDGIAARVLREPIAAVEPAPVSAAADEAGLAQSLARMQAQLSELLAAVDVLVATATTPLPLAVVGATETVTPTQMLAQTQARTVQIAGLVAGVRGALDVLAVAVAKGRETNAQVLQDAMLEAIQQALPQVTPAAAS